MKIAHNHIGEEMSMHDIFYLLYQAFGADAVAEIASVLKRRGEDIQWLACEPCDFLTPFHDHTCLTCGTSVA